MLFRSDAAAALEDAASSRVLAEAASDATAREGYLGAAAAWEHIAAELRLVEVHQALAELSSERERLRREQWSAGDRRNYRRKQALHERLLGIDERERELHAELARLSPPVDEAEVHLEFTDAEIPF